MSRLTPEMIAAIQGEYAKNHSYKKTGDKFGVGGRTVKAHVSGLYDNSLTTNPRGISKTIRNREADDRDMNKKIYRELRRGAKTEEIIEKYGFPSRYVQAEYELFTRNRNTDMIDFQKRYIDGIEAYVKSERPDLQRNLDKFHKIGYLTNDELLELEQEIIVNQV